MDEIKFCVSFGRINKIIIFDFSKALLLINADNRKYITWVKSIGGRQKRCHQC